MTYPYSSDKYNSIYGDIAIIDGIPFIRRTIDDRYYDLCSVYPFTYEHILNPSLLLSKLKPLTDCVSLTIVSNPLTPPLRYSEENKEHWFSLCKPFKNHYIVNLSKSSRDTYSDNNKRNVKKFYSKGGIVEVIPQACIKPWMLKQCYEQYLSLCEKHKVKKTALAWFTPEQFEQQFFVDNCILLVASHGDDLVNEIRGWALFHRYKDNMYYHLSATSPAGYKISSSYGILDTAIGLFRQLGFNYLELGSGSGVDSDPNLEYFKVGWGSISEKNYIYGKVNNPVAYARLSRGKDLNNPYFPLYRS